MARNSSGSLLPNLLSMFAASVLVSIFLLCERSSSVLGGGVGALASSSTPQNSISMYAITTAYGNWLALASDSTGQKMFGLASEYSIYTCGIYISTDYGRTWAKTMNDGMCIPETPNDANPAYLTSDSSGTYVVAGQYGSSSYYVSVDSGTTWTRIYSYSFISMASDSSGKYLVALTNAGIMVSSTYGYQLMLVSPLASHMYGIGSVVLSGNGRVGSAAMCGTSGEFYTVTVYSCSEVLSGGLWTTSTVNLTTSCYAVKLANDVSGAFVVMIAGPNVYRSADGGVSWDLFENQPPRHEWVSVSCDATCERIVIGSTMSGSVGPVLYSSNDFGNSWQAISVSNTSYSAYSGIVVSDDGNFIATSSLQNAFICISTKPVMLRSATVQANESSVTYVFSSLGYVGVGESLYASVMLLSSYVDSSVLTVSVSDKNGTILTRLYEGKCASITTCSYSNTTCAVNILIPAALIQNNDIYGEGTLTVVANLTSSNGGQYESCTDNNDVEYLYELQFELSPQPLSVLGTASKFTFHPLVLLVIFVACGTLASFGYWLGTKYSQYPKARAVSRPEVIMQLAALGYLVSTELWFVLVFQLHGSDNIFRAMSLLLIEARVLSILPGIYLLMKVYGPPVIRSGFYLENMDIGFMRDNGITMRLLSAVLLLDARVIVYFPWKTTLPEDDHFGYPDAPTLDLCSIFKGISSVVCLIAQITCYSDAVLSRGGSSWVSYDLGVRLMFILYSIFFVVSCVPTVRILYSYLEEVVILRSQSRFSLRRAVKASIETMLSVDTATRWQRLKRLKKAPFSVLLSVAKFAVMVYIFASMMTWRCKVEDRLDYFWMQYMRAVLVSSALSVLLELFVVTEFDEYDPHVEMVTIARTYSLDARKLTSLLRPLPVMFSVLEVFNMVFLFIVHRYVLKANSWRTSIYDDYYECRDSSQGVIPNVLLFMFAFEFFCPMLVLMDFTWRKTQSILDTLKAMLRIEIFIICMFLKAMLAWVFPLCLLTNFSAVKIKHATEQSEQAGASDAAKDTPELLSFELRDNWLDAEAEGSSTILRYIYVICDKLRQRFTVVYSLVKLCGTIAFTLFVNTDYLSCGNPSSYHDAVSCPISYEWDSLSVGDVSASKECAAICMGFVYQPKFIYPEITVPGAPPLPPTPWECTVQISGECTCNHWMVFQFIVIVLHVIHYMIQCYFYIRYNYFDPQQNQINCVETYTFAGENLTLFLTQPSICLLSMIEAICIVLVWIEVMLPFGGYCPSWSASSVSLTSFDVQFAVFITFVEVYKANLSTFGKLCNRREYWWALWSLFRIDLFVFYGFTLFLQTFFFPFSLVGYTVSKYVRLAHDEEETDRLDDALLDKNSAVGSIETKTSLSMDNVS
jgi:photosystem II stability/assembly factor-like uncharacterized protein